MQQIKSKNCDIADDKQRRQFSPSLKEQCHEDFAVLGQFCAKIITLRLYT